MRKGLAPIQVQQLKVGGTLSCQGAPWKDGVSTSRRAPQQGAPELEEGPT